MLSKPAVFVAALLIPLNLAWAQEEEPKPAPEQAQTLEGMWPSPQLMNSLLVRWADRLGEEYGLDDEQQVKLRELTIARGTKFLHESRTALQPLLNQYLEMRMGPEPPDKKAIQAWAERATPVFAQVREQLDQGRDELREIMDPLQRAKFELESVKLGAGVQVAEEKLKRWREGDFEPRELWLAPQSERRRRREERRQQRAAERRQAAGLPVATPTQPKAKADQIASELEAWERYVAQFIRTYELDEAQRTAALSCLSELKQRALDHGHRRRDEISRLESRIRDHTGKDEELAEIQKELHELYGPIDDLFTELKDRIELIPTSEQRERTTPRNESRKGQLPGQ